MRTVWYFFFLRNTITIFLNNTNQILEGNSQEIRLARTPNIWQMPDEWMRHRLRAIHLKHWKQGRTIYRQLRARGLSDAGARRVAANGRRLVVGRATTRSRVLPATSAAAVTSRDLPTPGGPEI